MRNVNCLGLLPGLAVLALSACGESREPDTSAASAELQSFASCEALEGYLKQVARTEMYEALAAARQSEYGGVPIYAGGPARGEEDSSAPPTTGGAVSDGGSAPTHSETNNQEHGVDEADIVKTDGSYVYLVTAGKLVIVKSYPANELSIVGEPTKVEGEPIELFTYPTEQGAQARLAVVFSTVVGEGVPVPLRRTTSSGAQGDAYFAPCLADGPCGGGWGWPAVTKITVYDVSDKSVAPRPVRALYTQENYVSSRLVASSVRTVLEGYVQGPALQYWPNVDWTMWQSMTASQKAAAFRQLEIENLQKINEAELGEWIPMATEVRYENGIEESSTGYAAPCEQFLRPRRLDGRGVLDVVTMNLDELGRPAHHAAIVSHGGVVYASESSIYVATHPWYSPWAWWGRVDGSFAQEHTLLHKFDIGSDVNTAKYVASGVVPGHVLNQFALDEEGGFLRVATTTGGFGRGIAVDAVTDVSTGSSSSGGGATPEARREAQSGVRCEDVDSTNHLFVLGQSELRAGRLDIVGSVQNLACGEQIDSARFLGHRGYMFTSQALRDPLFAFDLTDPKNPVLLGELSFPGLSQYAHPLDETHLLTIGQSADRRITLRIFDVTDMRNPIPSHTFEFAEEGSSEAQWNHKAFSYFAPFKLLAIPVSLWSRDSWENSFVGLKVFSVDVNTGFQEVASINHAPYYTPNDSCDYCYGYSWYTEVRRSFTIGEGPDAHLYSLSGRALVANPLENLDTATSFVSLPTPEPYPYPPVDDGTLPPEPKL